MRNLVSRVNQKALPPGGGVFESSDNHSKEFVDDSDSTHIGVVLQRCWHHFGIVDGSHHELQVFRTLLELMLRFYSQVWWHRSECCLTRQ